MHHMKRKWIILHKATKCRLPWRSIKHAKRSTTLLSITHVSLVLLKIHDESRFFGNLLIICFCIARWQKLFGTRFSAGQGIAWLMFKRVVDLLACWKGFMGIHNIAASWKIISLCLLWYLWLERNVRCFDDGESSLGEFKEFFFRTLCLWANVFVLNGDDLHDFLLAFPSS